MIASDATYWTTIAQVSATFVALIFAGLSIFLGNIHSAIREAQLKYPLKENSSSAMHAAIWSNFCLFVLPLIASLGIIIQSEYPKIWAISFWSFVAILGVILSLNLLLFFKRDTRKVRNLLYNEVPVPRKILGLRIWLGIWGISIIVILYGVIMFLMNQYDIAWLLDIVFLMSIIGGLGIGIFDLIAFDSGNTLFRIDKDYYRIIQDQERYIQEQLVMIDYLYEVWIRLTSNPALRSRIDNAKIEFTSKNNFSESFMMMKRDYDNFIRNIERHKDKDTGRFWFAKRILVPPKKMVTLKELRTADEEMKRLYEAVTDFHTYLSNQLDRWEQALK